LWSFFKSLLVSGSPLTHLFSCYFSLSFLLFVIVFFFFFFFLGRLGDPGLGWWLSRPTAVFSTALPVQRFCLSGTLMLLVFLWDVSLAFFVFFLFVSDPPLPPPCRLCFFFIGHPPELVLRCAFLSYLFPRVARSQLFRLHSMWGCPLFFMSSPAKNPH